uniref:(northern house mosquito) hypothetical protein n=1 Tax=Culex pipiens TaxID=7175 RepID=A0A8D8KJF7_CULPI
MGKFNMYLIYFAYFCASNMINLDNIVLLRLDVFVKMFDYINEINYSKWSEIVLSICSQLVLLKGCDLKIRQNLFFKQFLIFRKHRKEKHFKFIKNIRVGSLNWML